MQEMTTRWWSILIMLVSIMQSKDPVVLALARAGKTNQVLTNGEIKLVQELITLLGSIKFVSDTVLKIDIQTDSNTIKEMKKHMLHKLSTRYSDAQKEYLTSVAYGFKIQINS